MKLSRLVYNCIKNIKYIDDNNFYYDSFIQKVFDNDPDYSANIAHIFSSLNRAIHRLSDRNKIPFKIEEIDTKDIQANRIDISELPVKSVKNVFTLNEYGEEQHYAFREMGNKYILVKGFLNEGKLYVEYAEDIKYFDETDYYYPSEDEEDIEEKDIELKDYGINNTMVSYIEEYVKGELFSTISPEMASSYLTKAEQYFADLDDYSTEFSQPIVSNIYKVM